MSSGDSYLDSLAQPALAKAAQEGQLIYAGRHQTVCHQLMTRRAGQNVLQAASAQLLQVASLILLITQDGPAGIERKSESISHRFAVKVGRRLHLRQAVSVDVVH